MALAEEERHMKFLAHQRGLFNTWMWGMTSAVYKDKNAKFLEAIITELGFIEKAYTAKLFWPFFRKHNGDIVPLNNNVMFV